MNRKQPLPPTYFWIAAVLSLLFHFALPIARLIPYPWTLAGIVPVIFGGVLNIWADQLFKKRNTTVKPFERPAQLITEGPFAFSRHPMYLGMVAILLGISIICGSLMSFVGPIFYWVFIRVRFIPAEEQSMIDVFGDQYSAYKDQVHSLI